MRDLDRVFGRSALSGGGDCKGQADSGAGRQAEGASCEIHDLPSLSVDFGLGRANAALKGWFRRRRGRQFLCRSMVGDLLLEFLRQ